MILKEKITEPKSMLSLTQSFSVFIRKVTFWLTFLFLKTTALP